MSEFLTDQFILENKYAEQLYFDHAQKMPIIDYHNHLPPADIWNNRTFKDITEACLEGYHYKRCAVRALGVYEASSSAGSDSYEAFNVRAQSIPFSLREPLYHSTPRELKAACGVEALLNATTARKIYALAPARLQETAHS